MNSEPAARPPEPSGDDLAARWLSAYDDALASGTTPTRARETPPGVGPGASEDLALLRLLDQLRPRLSSSPAHIREEGAEPETRYVLRQLHASGGVGQIWLARDTELDREVALKLLRPDRAGDPGFEARFLREARITARLQHPGIVPVYELVPGDHPDADDQPPFYTMRLVPGTTLSKAIQAYHARRAAGTARPLDLTDLLNAFVSVCNTIAYAHSRGVVHRDLKGLNVALGEYGEVIVLDWGFAKMLGDPKADREQHPLPVVETNSGVHTLTGQVVGTPAYMAPEQAHGRPDRIDARTDVFGLGAILYEVLTGTPPYPGDDVKDVLRRVREGSPPAPSTLRPGVPRALEAVCRKAMARDSQDRYAAAADVAREVQHWLGDEPVDAYREPIRGRLRRWTRRHRPLVAGLSALSLTALLGSLVALAFVRQEQSRTAEAKLFAAIQQATARTEAAHDLQRQLYFHRIALAERTLAANNPSRATELLGECPAEYRGWEWYCLSRLCLADPLPLRGHEGTVLSVAFSPDDKCLVSASFDGTARLWDAKTGRLRLTLTGHEGVIYDIAFDPDGSRVATAGWDGKIKIWEVASGKLLTTLTGHTDHVNRVAYNPAGDRLVSLGSDATLRVWDPLEGKLLHTFHAPTPTDWLVTCMAYAPDGRHVALSGPVNDVVIFDIEKGEAERRLVGHRNIVRVVAFSPDGRWLASGDGDVGRCDSGEVKVWSLGAEKPRYTLTGHTDPINGLAFSPDAKRLVSASQDHTIKVWDLDDGREALTLHGHSDVVRTVAFSRDGYRLASAGADHQAIKIWDATPHLDPQPTRVARTLSAYGRFFGIAFRDDGRRLAAVDDTRAICVWDPVNRDRKLTVREAESDVFALAYRPGANQIATADSQGEVIVLDGPTGDRVWSVQGHPTGPIKGLTYSPDGRRLVTASWDRTARVWDADSGQERLVLKGHGEPLSGAAFSPAGDQIATASYDQLVKVWDAATGKELHTLRGHGSAVFAVAFAPTGGLLASASNDGTVKLWSTRTWRERHTLRGHSSGVRAVAFSPDGRLLASAGHDWTVRLWRSDTGAEVAVLRGHLARVHGLAFAPDGKMLASAGYDGEIKLWNVGDLTP